MDFHCFLFRYMMLVQGDGEVFFIDRENSVFEVNGLKFPHVRENRCLRDTLMDGVSYSFTNSYFIGLRKIRIVSSTES